MPTTFQAFFAFLIAVLPGALAVWGFERVSGRWAIGLSDRLLRFLGISALMHAAAAPATYLLWHAYLREGALQADEKLPLELWGVALLYVAVPLAVGTLLAWGAKAKWPGFVAVVGKGRAPTAWDFVFHDETDGWVRLKLKSGVWIGGAYASGSYVGGYPEPADIYVSRSAVIDPQTGVFALDAAGNPELGESGLLVRWNEVEFLDFKLEKS